MKYELAKKLKDAGFPMDYNLDSFSEFDKRTANISIPLEELIEACGKYFQGLRKSRLHKHWTATWRNGFAKSKRVKEGVYRSGETAIEAVANLWLALNEK